MLDEGKIERIISEDRYDGEKAVTTLITAANQAGGHDNITAILLQNEGI
jgi:serine/threonine protein phosphatase PrpC